MDRWDDLRFFLAVARHGSLTRAARILKVEHSTVYRRIGALEAAMETRLFDRLRRGYALTTDGLELMTHAQRVEAEMAAIERRVTGKETRLSGKVTVTSVSTIGIKLLPRYLSALRARHPGIHLEVDVDQRMSVLADRDADIAIRVARGEEKSTVGRKVCDLGASLYASRRYLEGRAIPRTFAELAGHDFVLLGEALDHLPLNAFIREHAPDPTVTFRANNFIALLEAVKAGAGIGLLSCHVCDEEPELVRLFPPLDLRFPLWLVTHKDLRKTARVRAVLDFLFERLKADEALLAGRLRGAG